MYRTVDMQMDGILKLIHYFRMSKHVRSHSEKDDPRPPPYMEEEGANQVHGVDESCPNNLTYRIEEAMEEEDDTASAKQVKEGDAESNASSLCGLPKGGGVPQWSTLGMMKLSGQIREN